MEGTMRVTLEGWLGIGKLAKGTESLEMQERMGEGFKSLI